MIAYYLLPSKKEEAPVSECRKDVKCPISTDKKEEGTAIPFTSMDAYMEKLREPVGRNAACISICHMLMNLADSKKSPVRLNFTLNTTYKADGTNTNSNQSAIAGFSAGRWYKLRDIEISVDAVVPMVSEMIEVMSQYGWASMNDSLEQLQSYMQGCLKNTREYAVLHTARTDEDTVIRVMVSMVVCKESVNNANNSCSPQILIRTSLITGDELPVNSQLQVFFRQSQYTGAKSAA